MKELSWKISNDFESEHGKNEPHPIEYCLTLYDLMYYLRSTDKVFYPLGVGFYAMDYSTKNYLYVSNNFEKISGHNPQEFKKGGGTMWKKIIHPDDRINILSSIEKESKIILNDYQQRYYVFKGSYRIISYHGSIKQVFQQSTIYKSKCIDGLLEIGMISETPLLKIKNTYPNDSEKINNMSDMIIQNNEPDPGLSEREKEIDALLKRRLSSKEISDYLNISIHTVNAHRRKINEKKWPAKRFFYSDKMKIV